MKPTNSNLSSTFLSQHSNGCCDFLFDPSQKVVLLNLPPFQPVPQTSFHIRRPHEGSCPYIYFFPFSGQQKRLPHAYKMYAYGSHIFDISKIQLKLYKRQRTTVKEEVLQISLSIPFRWSVLRIVWLPK